MLLPTIALGVMLKVCNSCQVSSALHSWSHLLCYLSSLPPSRRKPVSILKAHSSHCCLQIPSCSCDVPSPVAPVGCGGAVAEEQLNEGVSSTRDGCILCCTNIPLSRCKVAREQIL